VAINKKSSVYIESSVVSYFTNPISSDIITAGKQQTTRIWWETVLPKMKPYVSDYVFREIQKGDSKKAEARRQAVASIELLDETPLVVELAKTYLKKLPIPRKSELDAYHLAIATAFKIDFLVSWNCKHIANIFMIRPIQKINDGFNLSTPLICIPTVMIED